MPVSRILGGILFLGLLADGALLLAAGTPLHKSGPLQITNDGSTLWVVNPDHDSVSRIDTVTEAVTEYPLPDVGTAHRPSGLALRADGSEVWVAAHDSARVYVLDASDGSVLAEHVMHTGSGPISVAISPDDSLALVALHRKAEIAVFDTASRNLVTTITGLFRRPFGIAFSSTPNEAWISHTMMDGEDSHISSIDTASFDVSSRIILKSVNPKSPNQIAGDPDPIPEGGYLLIRGHIAQPPGISKMWVPVQYQNFHNPVFTPDSTIQSSIHRIDIPTRTHNGSDKVVLTAVYAHDNTTLLGDGWNAGIAGPVDIAFSADGSTAYQVNAHSNDIIVFPTNITKQRPNGAPALPEISVGDNPMGITLSPTAEIAYVFNYLSRDVSVVDLDNEVELNRIALNPTVPEPIAASVLLGNKLFNTSADPRASSNQKIACASCHPNAEQDGLLWDFASLGAGSRDTFSLLGLGLSYAPQSGGLGQLHRSGDRDEVQDFDLTFSGSIMGGTGFLSSPNPPLGAPNAGVDPDLDAVADYLLTLPPLENSPHRNFDGTLPEAAIRGAAIYKNTDGGPLDIGCIGCHPAPSFTDLGFHDVDGHAPPPENEGPNFNTPSLVGAFDSGPFVQVVSWQDGFTLGGVLRSAYGQHGDTTGLNRTQMRDVEAFLECIDGAMVGTDLDTLVDSAPPRILAVNPVSLDSVEVVFNETVDVATASDPANYLLVAGASSYAPTSAVVNALHGNRVRLAVALDYGGCDVTYTLMPGSIEDAAGLLGAANNILDVGDVSNQKSFTLDGTITVTFGDTGAETFPGVARDASFNAGLGNVSHAAWRLYPFVNPEMKGFVQFDFTSILANDCGVTDSSDILEVKFSALPHYGNLNDLELHRCLKPWGEPPNDWCFGCPGAVTRTHATWNSIPWSQSGANNYGSSGTSPSHYYPMSNFDLAATVDGTASVDAINERVEFAGPLIDDAFRFWFDNPSINHGYCVEVTGNNGTGTEFWANDQEAGRNGLVLTITFAIGATSGAPDCNGNGTADDCDIASGTSQDTNGNGIPDECEGPDSDFTRGDCDGEGSYTLADPIRLLNYLFVTPDPLGCQDACDGNDDGALQLDDGIYLLTSLFAGGPPPLPPFPGCGVDPTADSLPCVTHPPCD